MIGAKINQNSTEHKVRKLFFIRSISIFLLFTSLLVATLLVSAFPRATKASIVTEHGVSVIKIIDGDTIWVKNNKGFCYKVRLSGINAPEICNTLPQPYGYKAKSFIATLISPQTPVYLKYATGEHYDKYGRVLAQVYRESDNLWINLQMIKEGLAYTYFISHSSTGMEKLLHAENRVIEAHKNIWSLSYYRPIKAEEAKNYVGKYKIIVGKVTKVNITRHSIWLEFEGLPYLRHTNHQAESSNFKNAAPLRYRNNYIFAVKVNKTVLFEKKHYSRFIGKTVVVRGYIEPSTYGALPPYVHVFNKYTLLEAI